MCRIFVAGRLRGQAVHTVRRVDDPALVAALVRRDPEGLEGVYRRYADRLYTYCVSVLHDRDAAADVVHDTFLIAVHRAGQLREPERLRAWLYTIARRECLRVLRAGTRQVPLPTPPPRPLISTRPSTRSRCVSSCAPRPMD